MSLKKRLEPIVLEMVAEALINNGGNQSKAARELDISRGTLRKYMELLDDNGRPKLLYNIEL